MVITFCLKRIKITRSVFYRSRRGCYWTWAKFWQRNCKAKLENGEEMLRIFMHLLHSLLAAKAKHLHSQKQFQQLRRLSNQRFHLLIFDWRTKIYPKWRVIVKKYSIGNNKKASAHSPFLQKSAWVTFVIIRSKIIAAPGPAEMWLTKYTRELTTIYKYMTTIKTVKYNLLEICVWLYKLSHV